MPRDHRMRPGVFPKEMRLMGAVILFLVVAVVSMVLDRDLLFS